jgi:hypothetical protein
VTLRPDGARGVRSRRQGPEEFIHFVFLAKTSRLPLHPLHSLNPRMMCLQWCRGKEKIHIERSLDRGARLSASIFSFSTTGPERRSDRLL